MWFVDKAFDWMTSGAETLKNIALLPTKVWYETTMNLLDRGITGVAALIDGLLYNFVSVCYQLFLSLARVELFNSAIFNALKARVYLLVAIVALFIFTFSMMKAMVDPDSISKTVIKSFKSLVTSIILIIFVPTIFQYAYSLQAAIIDSNIIGKIFSVDISKYKDSDDATTQSASADSMSSICSANGKNITITDSSGKEHEVQSIKITKSLCQGNYLTMSVLEAFYTPSSYNVVNNQGYTWGEARKYMIYTGHFSYMQTFIDNAIDNSEDQHITYTFLLCSIAAFILIYVLISFSIDLAVRSAKITFYQIIAPIPILLRMIPGKEGQFEKWYKGALSAFLEIFERLIIIDFIVLICSNLLDIIDSLEVFKNNSIVVKAILVLGLFMFAKQAPKLFKEALGIEEGSISIGIKNKLTSTPVLGKAFQAGYDAVDAVGKAGLGAATGALGGALTSTTNHAGILSGLKAGAIKGAKGGGNQFNRQRQAVYDSYGLKGKAGLFGGQSYFDRASAQATKDSKNAGIENIRNWVNNRETRKDFTDLKSDWKNKLLNGYTNDKGEYIKGHNQLEIEYSQKITDLEKVYRDEQARLLQEKAQATQQQASNQAQIADLEKKMADAKAQSLRNGTGFDGGRVKEYQSQIEALKNNNNANLINEIDAKIAQNKIAWEQDSQIDYFKDLLEQEKQFTMDGSSSLEEEAHSSARATMKKLDATYANYEIALEKHATEQEKARYLESKEGRQAIWASEAGYKGAISQNSSTPPKDDKNRKE